MLPRSQRLLGGSKGHKSALSVSADVQSAAWTCQNANTDAISLDIAAFPAPGQVSLPSRDGWHIPATHYVSDIRNGFIDEYEASYSLGHDIRTLLSASGDFPIRIAFRPSIIYAELIRRFLLQVSGLGGSSLTFDDLLKLPLCSTTLSVVGRRVLYAELSSIRRLDIPRFTVGSMAVRVAEPGRIPLEGYMPGGTLVLKRLEALSERDMQAQCRLIEQAVANPAPGSD
jgi:hypothetical protein